MERSSTLEGMSKNERDSEWWLRRGSTQQQCFNEKDNDWGKLPVYAHFIRHCCIGNNGKLHSNCCGTCLWRMQKICAEAFCGLLPTKVAYCVKFQGYLVGVHRAETILRVFCRFNLSNRE